MKQLGSSKMNLISAFLTIIVLLYFAETAPTLTQEIHQQTETSTSSHKTVHFKTKEDVIGTVLSKPPHEPLLSEEEEELWKSSDELEVSLSNLEEFIYDPKRKPGDRPEFNNLKETLDTLKKKANQQKDRSRELLKELKDYEERLKRVSRFDELIRLSPEALIQKYPLLLHMSQSTKKLALKIGKCTNQRIVKKTIKNDKEWFALLEQSWYNYKRDPTSQAYRQTYVYHFLMVEIQIKRHQEVCDRRMAKLFPEIGE